MKHLICCLFIVCILMSTPLYAQQTLTFSTLDLGIMTEINSLILKEVYKRLGINIIIKQYPAERALHLANNGEVDGDLIRRAVVVKLAPNLLQIPTALYQGRATAFSKNKNIVLSSWKSLKPYRIAIMRGHKIAEVNTREFNPEIINTPEALFYFLQKDRADIVIYPYIPAMAYLKKMEFTSIYPLSESLDKVPLYHFLHKKHANLIPKVDKIIQEIVKEGLPEKITQQVLAEIK